PGWPPASFPGALVPNPASDGGFLPLLFLSLSRRPPRVILSAVGAKDLLFVSAAPPQVLRSRVPRDGTTPWAVCGTAGPSLARVPRDDTTPRALLGQQILRSRGTR